MKLHGLVNEDGRMWSFTPGDRLTYVGAFEVNDPPNGTLSPTYDALERLWAIGNREGADVNGKTWPSTVRSMCMGDVVLVERTGGFDAYKVASLGFDALTPDEIIDSLVATGRKGEPA